MSFPDFCSKVIGRIRSISKFRAHYGHYLYKYRYNSYYKYEHYFMLSILSNPEQFRKLVGEIHNPLVKSFRTVSRINPLDYDFLIPEAEVIKQKGKPKYVLNFGRPLFNHSILFYKEYIGEYSFITQFHFFFNKLLIVKQDVSYNTKKGGDRIIDLILKKYSVSHFEIKDLEKNIRIEDTFESYILVRRSAKVEIIYFKHDYFIAGRINEVVEASEKYAEHLQNSMDLRLMRRL